MVTGAERVPFVIENVRKCLCPGCRVQAESQRTSDLKAGLREVRAGNPPEREKVPALYCSTGKAPSTDLDGSRNCACGNCQIFDAYHLVSGQPVGYYCQEGSAR